MYAKKIQIENYGPIDRLEIVLPFNGDNPKPILLVGQNGSGKSVLLSHIVNGLMSAQGILYPENSEVEKRKVFKLRSPFYIKSGKEYSCARIEFERDIFFQELVLGRPKEGFPEKPMFSINSMNKLWESMLDTESNRLGGTDFRESAQKDSLKEIFRNNCILYFPPDRSEDPAWLNKENLKRKSEYTIFKHIEGYADRKIIQHSPLRENQNWLLDLTYDSSVFEINIRNQIISMGPDKKPVPVPIFLGHSGPATRLYHGIVLSILRIIFQAGENLRFGVDSRRDRKFSLMQNDQILVPNIFQFSSGETSLLNLFFSILRDFDLTEKGFAKIEEIRGIVVVDEIDLHLHADHQHKVLPELMKIFPRVQFIVTTHSPLFILGMQKTFGEGGFALYRLPQGQEISPEEFSEFGNAYRSFTKTQKFKEDIRKEIENAQKPLVFMEGKTDVKYLEKAAELLGQKELLQSVKLMYGGSDSKLDTLYTIFSHRDPRKDNLKIILLYDCDRLNNTNEGNLFKRNIPEQKNHPLKKGIENLFEKRTLKKARESKPAFIDIVEGHKKTVRGQKESVLEEWTVNKDEKTNLCNYLCKNGTRDDFKPFRVIFDLLKEILES